MCFVLSHDSNPSSPPALKHSLKSATPSSRTLDDCTATSFPAEELLSPLPLLHLPLLRRPFLLNQLQLQTRPSSEALLPLLLQLLRLVLLLSGQLSLPPLLRLLPPPCPC